MKLEFDLSKVEKMPNGKVYKRRLLNIAAEYNQHQQITTRPTLLDSERMVVINEE